MTRHRVFNRWTSGRGIKAPFLAACGSGLHLKRSLLFIEATVGPAFRKSDCTHKGIEEAGQIAMEDSATIQQQLDQEMERLFQHFEQVRPRNTNQSVCAAAIPLRVLSSVAWTACPGSLFARLFAASVVLAASAGQKGFLQASCWGELNPRCQTRMQCDPTRPRAQLSDEAHPTFDRKRNALRA